MKHLVVALIVTSLFSVLGSGAVLITLLVFPKMRSKTFMQVIAYVSFGDILGNIPYVFPYRPGTGDPWCSTQAFLGLIGYPIGWCWTVVLVYLLFCLGAVGRLPPLWPMHIICWLLPLTVALTTLAYSKYYGPHGIDTCSINTSIIAVGAHIGVYYGVLFFCIVIIWGLLFRLYLLQRAKDPNVSSLVFQRAKNTLQLYPAAMIFFWFPHLFTEMMLIFGYWKYEVMMQVYYAFVVLKVLYGLAAAIIFFWCSNEARTLWWSIFRRIGEGQINFLQDTHSQLDDHDPDMYDDHDAEAIIRERLKEMTGSRAGSEVQGGSEVQMSASFSSVVYPSTSSPMISVSPMFSVDSATVNSA